MKSQIAKWFGLFFCLTLLPLVTNAEALLVPNDEDCLPLKKVNAHITIDNQVVTYEIDQYFDNFHNTTYDVGTYYCPLPEDASVFGFGHWEFDELHYYSLVDHQGGGGGTGGFTPQDLRNFLGENYFKSRLENIEPGLRGYRLEYTQLMQYDFGEYSMDYLLGMGGLLTIPADTINVELTVRSSRTIESYSLEGYEATVNHSSDDSLSLSFLVEDIVPVNDVHFSMNMDREEVGMWLMPHRSVQTEDGYFLAVLEPGNVQAGEIEVRSFTFVLDVSGSMSFENRIVEAKEAAVYCIQHLRPEDTFNIITFNYEVNSWQENAVQATEANINEAVTFIENINPVGGTNLNDAILTALNITVPQGVARQILLISDGYPTNGTTNIPSIIENIEDANNNHTSIFTVAVGVRPDGISVTNGLEFLNLISYENYGLGIYLEPGTDDVATEIARFYDRFSQPVISQLACDFGTVQVSELYPIDTATMFAGMQTVFAGRYAPAETAQEVTINGTISGVPTSLTYGPFEFPAETEGYAFVPRMWAIKKIDYLIAWMAVYGEDYDTIETIRELSIRYGILTPYTSYDTPVEETDDLRIIATRTNAGVEMSWNVKFSFNGNLAFDIYRGEYGATTMLKLNDEPIEGRSFTDVTAAKNVHYVYRIVAHGEDMLPVSAEIDVKAGNDDDLLVLISPNPFNNYTVVKFDLAAKSKLSIRLFDILGREVETVFNGIGEAGTHTHSIDASQMSSGVYFLEFNAQSVNGGRNITKVQRLTLVK